jgi:ATP-dependent DNA helicase RecG
MNPSPCHKKNGEEKKSIVSPARASLSRWLDSSAADLKGVGPARLAILADAGISTFRDMILVLPRRYRERVAPGDLAALVPGQKAAARGEVKRSTVSGRGRRRNLRVLVVDGTASVELVLFGRAFLKKTFRPGRTVSFQGAVTADRGRLQILSPDFHLDGDAGPGFPGLLPVYSLPDGIFPRMFHGWVAHILDKMPDQPDWRAAALSDCGLVSLAVSLRHVHHPRSAAEAEEGRRRIAYEEFFALQVGLARERRKRGARQSALSVLPVGLDRLYRGVLPFTLTAAQERAVVEIGRDLRSDRPMHRLLQGDVGSGKTAVALYPLLAAGLSGGQGAIMAPTEVLAVQHARVITPLLKAVGLGTFLLRAGTPQAEARRIVDDPGVHCVIGTHSLIQSRVRFRDLRACVVDEQHKFGVRQRWTLKVKGTAPHVLIMTATPIPRTLSLTLYGELDISILDTLPPGRKPVLTRAAASLGDEDVRSRIESDLASGGRVFVVCPLVNESERLDLEAAVAVHGRLLKNYGGRCGVGLLHGRLDGAAKNAALAAFRSGETPLLATTVVVEVGVDIPEASTVVIMDAWRFGLSQLHQIRGRVGRGSRDSRCYLVGEAPGEAGRRRIAILLREDNGFRIAEEDLRMRGPGEPVGLRQHGLPRLRAGDYVADVDLMAAARDDARRLVDGGGVPIGPLLDPVKAFGHWIG